MTIVATQKFTRQTPRKLRLVANTVRKLPLTAAIEQLAVIERKASIGILKVVQQAIANAVNNHGFQYSDLTLKNILVTEGARYKRYRAVSRGRGHGVLKRTSHIRVELEAGAVQSTETVQQPEVADEKAVAKTKKTTETTKQAPKKTKSVTKTGKTRSASEKSKKV